MARSIDIQNVIAKTQAVERLYQTQKQQPETDQRQFTLEVQHTVEEKQRTAQPSPKSDKVQIHADKGKNKEKKKSDRKHKKKLESDLMKLTPRKVMLDGKGQIIDIKV